MSGLNQLSGSGTVGSIPGAPIDPALGLPRAVVGEKKWEALGELIAGIGLVAICVVWLAATVAGMSKDGRWPLAFIFLLIAPFVFFDGWRRLRRGSCVIVAENGFDDRTGTIPAGPVLWSEVENIDLDWAADPRMNAMFVSVRRRKQLVVKLNPGKRAPFSSLGAQPRQIDKASITLENMEGGDKRLPHLMWQAWQAWRQDHVPAARS
jgi:hypothetical protein